MDKDSKENISFEIVKDSKKDEIAEILKREGLVRSAYALSFLIKREEAKKEKEGELVLHPGEYELSPALSPREIVKKLWSIEKISRTFIIKAGDSYRDVAQSIARSGLFLADETLAAMTQRALLVKLRLSAGIPEGYFLPGTYTFSKPIEPEKVIESLIKSSNESILSKIPTILKRAEGLKLDLYQVLILASLIEKEGLNDKEKKNFSSLLHNRLALDMPMESVPALNYGINILTGNNNPLTDADRTKSNPYNTFIRPKLPATPICSASLESIRAALYPNDTTFIYFIRNSDGTFSYYSNKKNFQQKIPS